MTTGHVYIAASLDGYIARLDGNLDWLMKQPTEGENFGYDDFMESVDGLVMGRGTYEKVLSFGEWPYARPVMVLSNSLTQAEIPGMLEGKVRVSGAPPADVMQELEDEGWDRAYVDGGKVIQSFLRAGLIADMIITHVPILLGSGIPLFGPVDQDIDLTHLETRAFASGLIRSHYEVGARLTN